MALFGSLAAAAAEQAQIPARLDAFSTADGEIPSAWEPLVFPKVARHTQYRAVRDPGSGAWVVEATADASASGLVHRCSIDLRERPILRWRWKVDGVLARGDARRKDGDDYAARIYLTFEPKDGSLGFFERAALRLARSIYGDVPSRALNYIWASRIARESHVDSAYVGRFVKLLAVESGSERAGAWRSAERDVAADYRAVFGSEPPPVVGVALMTDTDDTGERMRAWYGDIAFVSRGETSANLQPDR